MFLDDDPPTLRTLPLPEVGPVASFFRRLIGWPHPYNTVTCAILRGEHVLVIFREPRPHPVDWDLAEGLMELVAHPNRFRRYPSYIREVTEWDIHEVEDSRYALQQLARERS